MIAIMFTRLADALRAIGGRARKVVAGEVLFRADDPVLSMFLVVTGTLQLVRSLPHGASLTLQRAGAGDVLAEASLFADCYHCDAVAAEESILHAVSRQRLSAGLRDDPDLSFAFARHLAHEVQRARAHAELLSLQTVGERIDAWLALHDGILPPRGRWRAMASEICVSPEALYRELARRR